MSEPRNNATKTRGKPFTSGNPGRPKGARHKLTLLAESLLEAEAEAVVRTVIDAAKSGDMTAARAVLDRILPARRSRPISISLPTVEKPADVLAAMSAVVASVANGDIDVDEGSALAELLDAKRRAIDSVDIERRLAALEAKDAK